MNHKPFRRFGDKHFFARYFLAQFPQVILRHDLDLDLRRLNLLDQSRGLLVDLVDARQVAIRLDDAREERHLGVARPRPLPQ